MNGARHRLALPLVLLLAGVALSCSTACLTSALIQSASDKAAAARRAAAEDRQRALIAQELTPALPPPGAGAREADRLHVAGGSGSYAIEASGDFSPPSAAAFAAATRQLYAHTVPFGTRFDLRTYSDANHTRTLVAQFNFDLIDEVNAGLRRALPPASPGTRESGRLQLWLGGDGAILYGVAAGDFTPEAMKAFAEAARQLRASLPRPPHFMITLVIEDDKTHRRRDVGKLDTAAPTPITPIAP